jgi:hypothetical protein
MLLPSLCEDVNLKYKEADMLNSAANCDRISQCGKASGAVL